jgi:hypothetical protein
MRATLSAEMTMRKLQLALLGAVAIGGLTIGTANAMPISNLSDVSANDGLLQDVRLVCNQFGRCWRTGPRYRYVRRHYIEPDYYYAPRRYAYAPAYAYGGPYWGGPYWGGPGVRFGFGFGPRWGW